MTDVDALVHGMTLEQKIGQLLMLAFDEGTLDEAVTRLHAGWLIVWKRNVHGPRETGELTNRIQQMSLPHWGMPLWLATVW